MRSVASRRRNRPHEHERRQWQEEYEESDKPSRDTGSDETDRELGDRYDTDDDDEPRYNNRADTEGLEFFAGLKTDIELNADRAAAGKSTPDGRGGPNMPMRTGSSNGNVWAVQWKPKK